MIPREDKPDPYSPVPPAAKHAYVVCRVSAPRRLHDRLTAIPWEEL